MSAAAKARYPALYDSIAAEWPVPSDTVTVITSIGPTFVRVSGPEGAPPLVMPMGRNSLQWRQDVAALSGAYRTYAVDVIYDHGRNVYRRVPAGVGDSNGWLDEIMDGLGLADGVSLVGLSYGGWLSAQCALHAPERLNKTVLLVPAGTVLPPSCEWIRGAVLLVNPSVSTDNELRGISVPTLCVVGENENIYSAQGALERLRTVAPLRGSDPLTSLYM